MGHASVPGLVPDPFAVPPPDDGSPGWIVRALATRGITRRRFLQWCSAMTAAMALPTDYAPRVAQALEAGKKPVLVWLEFQDCAGNTESMLRSSHPSVADVVLDVLSWEYHETVMAGAGKQAEEVLERVRRDHKGEYIVIVEGAIPTADDGMACAVGGRPFRDVVREVCAGAVATIAVGSCAFDGGAPGASGGRTGAVGVSEVAGEARLINLPGCPVNVENLTATIVNYLTFKELPPTGSRHRPLFAYGGLLHNQCERRAHYEFGEFALAWGDEGAQKGWCLYKLGCKGPETFANCPTRMYAARTSWAIKAGHGCIGCTMPDFWDSMGPAYSRLPPPLPFVPNINSDQVGLVLVGGIAAVTAAHGAATYGRELRNRALERRRRAEAGAGVPLSPPSPPTSAGEA